MLFSLYREIDEAFAVTDTISISELFSPQNAVEKLNLKYDEQTKSGVNSSVFIINKNHFYKYETKQ